MQTLALEEQECLHTHKVLTLLLDCSFCLARQSIAFCGGDNDANGNNLTLLKTQWIGRAQSIKAVSLSYETLSFLTKAH
jgi:hypothetical protein